MPADYPVPNRDAIASALETLLATKVVANPLPMVKSYPFPSYVSVYEKDSRGIIAFLVCDLSLIRCAGAALSMLPKSAAEPKPSEIWPEKILLDNFREIMNILAQFFNDKGQEHVRFINGFPHNKMPGMASTLLELGELKAAFELNIGGYGSGQIFIVYPAPNMRYNPPSIQPIVRRSTQVKAA